MASLKDEAMLVEENAELRAANQRLMRRLAKRDADTAALVEEVYRAARDAAVTVGKPGPIARPERDRRKDPLHALLHITDTHIGKRTPTYNMDVAADRWHQVINKAIRLTEIERADHPVRVIHLMLGGDLIEGVNNIFPGQAFEVDAAAFEQVFAAAGLIEESVVTLLGEYEAVHVWWVAGNHARIGRRGDYPRPDNLDALACHIARGRTQHLQRLEWHDPDGWFAHVHAGNYRALLVHGHQLPRTVPAILRKANQWASGVVPDFDAIFYGHVHSEWVLPLANGRCVFVTPSTESTNEYAQEVIAAQSQPAQRLHFVRPEKGLRAGEHLLFLK